MDRTEWLPGERGGHSDYHFLTSAVAPRPIAWVTTQDPQTGVVNAAPFSWFQTVCADPPTVMLAFADRPGGGKKDTLLNAEATGELVINGATVHDVDAIVASSAPLAHDESELNAAGIETTPSRTVSPPRIASAPYHLECRVTRTERIGQPGTGTTLLLAEVVRFAANPGLLDARGNLDPAKACLIARLGGREYLTVCNPFVRPSPGQTEAQ